MVTEPPPWIDPGNGFRLLVKSARYKALLDYGPMEMDEQEHEVWFDRSRGYSLNMFREDMASKIIWGQSQTIIVWGVDTESGSEWKVTTNEQFKQMIDCRMDVRVLNLVVEVVGKEGYQSMENEVNVAAASNVFCQSSAQGTSGVTTGDVVDSSSSHRHNADFQFEVDWSTLTVIPEDGDMAALVDEDKVFEAMGFKCDDEKVMEAWTNPDPLYVGAAGMEDDLRDAAIPVDDEDIAEPMIDWDRDNPDMSEGIIYPSMADFRLAIRQYAIVNEFELGTEKSDKTRFRGFCRAEGCPWRIRARTQYDSSVRVQINDNQHNCASTSRVCGTMASQAWVAERAIPLLRRKPGMGAKAVQEELQEKYNIVIPYQTVWYGRQRAADKLFGKWDDSFDWLYRFKAEVELRAPDSIVEIDTVVVENEVHFSRFFCAFKGAIDGFLKGCRPYISIDSTALNGQWNGHLPSAQALDGHNCMFPLAFGLFDSETKENWTWFMECLGRAIGPVPNLALCTDACPGLIAAVKKVFPWAEHRECFRHLMENMKKNFTGTVYVKNMWPAARAYTPEKHKYFMDKVLEASPGVGPWLNENHKLLWARSKFSPNIKCEYINNNLAECWNSWIKEYKDLPVDCLVDAIREKTLILWGKRRKISSALNGTILPAVIHQLNAATRGLGHLKVTKGHPNQAEVSVIYKDEEIRRHVVYLEQHMCTCNEWQVTGKPCPHALAVISTDRQPNMEKYVDMSFSVQKLQRAYAGFIPNITDKHQWPLVNKGFKLLPPIAKKRGVGRQRKNRILSCLERTGKFTRQVKCTGCGEYGHRSGSWKCSLTGTKKRKRTNKTKQKAGRKKTKKEEAAATTTTKNALPPTPRTRAAVAKEAAAAAKEAEVQATQVEATPPASPGPLTRRRLALSQSPGTSAPASPVPLAQPEMTPAKKITPRKKQLATKIKKGSTP